MLSDTDIISFLKTGRISVTPLNYDHIQPASIDLTLSNQFRVYSAALYKATLGKAVTQTIHLGRVEDARAPELLEVESEFPLYPGAFALATTVERVRLGVDVVGRVEGRSTLGRLGLMAHVTAGFADPGFEGQITLELHNVSPNTLVLPVGMRVCQLSFLRCTPATRPYGPDRGSKYQGQEGPTAARAETTP